MKVKVKVMKVKVPSWWLPMSLRVRNTRTSPPLFSLPTSPTSPPRGDRRRWSRWAKKTARIRVTQFTERSFAGVSKSSGWDEFKAGWRRTTETLSSDSVCRHKSVELLFLKENDSWAAERESELKNGENVGGSRAEWWWGDWETTSWAAWSRSHHKVLIILYVAFFSVRVSPFLTTNANTRF